MKGVYQTKSTNCVAACVASIFDLRLEDVPDFNPRNWDVELQAWLHNRGFAMLNMTFPDSDYNSYHPHGYTLGAVPVRGGGFPSDWKHCVVCLDGHVVWCPIDGPQNQPCRAEEYTVIYPLDVAGAKISG